MALPNSNEKRRIASHGALESQLGDSPYTVVPTVLQALILMTHLSLIHPPSRGPKLLLEFWFKIAGHPSDITSRVRAVIHSLWPSAADDSEAEVARLLDSRAGKHGLSSYLQKMCWEEHIKKCSKSRRKAPIYWQLATPSASYSVWLYYHRFTRDTFFQVLNEYVKPKLDHERQKLERVRSEAGPSQLGPNARRSKTRRSSSPNWLRWSKRSSGLRRCGIPTSTTG